MNLNKMITLIIFLINISNLLVLRNRSGLVAFAFCIFVYFITKIKLKTNFTKKVLLIPFVVLALFLIAITSNVIPIIVNLVELSFFTNYNVSDLNSLSAGRVDVYWSALEFIKNSLLFGELQHASNINGTPHNYLINLWLHYGILGMLPASILYIGIWVFLLYKLIIKKKFDLSLYLMLSMLVISFFEYTYPFAPTSTVSFSWILLGYYLNKERLNKTEFH